VRASEYSAITRGYLYRRKSNDDTQRCWLAHYMMSNKSTKIDEIVTKLISVAETKSYIQKLMPKHHLL
jgi:hypothetical protein